jgi:anti-sigma factor RsiW
MSHPTDLLTDYVDGTLAASTRAEVDAHLRTCATCGGEVALARAGAHAAESLDEPAAPEGLGVAATAEAARIAGQRAPEVTSIAGRARRRPTTSRVLAAAGAAAAVLLLVAIAPKLGQRSNGDLAQVAGGAAATHAPAAYPQATGVEIQHADYTFDALPQVVTQLQAALAVSAGIAAPAENGPAGASSVPALPSAGDVSTDPSRLPAATACLNKAFDTPSGTLSRVILASYQGQPAYLGVYLIGPGAELPPTLLQLNVASVHGCDPLGQTAARL